MDELAYIEDAILRAIQRKTSPRWSQQHHSHEAIKEAIDRALGKYPPYPRTLTHYVDQVIGNDTTGDGGENKPWKTIGKAETEASEKDTILAWGTFAENVTIDVAGVRLLGLGNGLTSIQGAANLTPKVTLDADSIEVALIYYTHGGFTGHGIWIDDSNYFNIHHNIMDTITGAYSGIAKTALPASLFGRIEHNKIRDGAQAGIYLDRTGKTTIYKNVCTGHAPGGDGIRLLANSLYNEVIENICNDNDEGIVIEGDNNNMVDNIAQGNTTANLIDTGAFNTWKSPQRDPQWGETPTLGNGTPGVLGVPLTLVTVDPEYPCNVALDISISNYGVGDDAVIQIEKRVDGVNWIVVGYITITNGSIVSVIGTPFYPGVAIPAAIRGFCFHLYSDTTEQFRVIVNQTAGVLKQVDYLYNLKREVF